MNFRILPPEEWWKLKSLSESEDLPDPRAVVFVLEQEGVILAMRVVGQMVWAGGMYVHPDFRRRGLATTLQYEVDKALKEAGMEGSYYMLPAVDTPAEETVRSFGFRKLPLAVYVKEI